MDDAPCCSFCGKGKDDVLALVTKDAVAICEECVDSAVTVLAGRGISPLHWKRWQRSKVWRWLAGVRVS